MRATSSRTHSRSSSSAPDPSFPNQLPHVPVLPHLITRRLSSTQLHLLSLPQACHINPDAVELACSSGGSLKGKDFCKYVIKAKRREDGKWEALVLQGGEMHTHHELKGVEEVVVSETQTVRSKKRTREDEEGIRHPPASRATTVPSPTLRIPPPIPIANSAHHSIQSDINFNLLDFKPSLIYANSVKPSPASTPIPPHPANAPLTTPIATPPPISSPEEKHTNLSVITTFEITPPPPPAKQVPPNPTPPFRRELQAFLTSICTALAAYTDDFIEKGIISIDSIESLIWMKDNHVHDLLSAGGRHIPVLLKLALRKSLERARREILAQS